MVSSPRPVGASGSRGLGPSEVPKSVVSTPRRFVGSGPRLVAHARISDTGFSERFLSRSSYHRSLHSRDFSSVLAPSPAVLNAPSRAAGHLPDSGGCPGRLPGTMRRAPSIREEPRGGSTRVPLVLRPSPGTPCAGRSSRPGPRARSARNPRQRVDRSVCARREMNLAQALYLCFRDLAPGVILRQRWASWGVQAPASSRVSSTVTVVQFGVLSPSRA